LDQGWVSWVRGRDYGLGKWVGIKVGINGKMMTFMGFRDRVSVLVNGKWQDDVLMG